jgi:hypothetical protein
MATHILKIKNQEYPTTVLNKQVPNDMFQKLKVKFWNICDTFDETHDIMVEIYWTGGIKNEKKNP